MCDYMTVWQTWMNLADPAIFRYENLLNDYYQQAERLIDFLELDLRSQKSAVLSKKTSPGTLHRKKGDILARARSGDFVTC